MDQQKPKQQFQDQMAKDFGFAFVKSHPEANAVFDVTFLVRTTHTTKIDDIRDLFDAGQGQGKGKKEAIWSASNTGSKEQGLPEDAFRHLYRLWLTSGFSRSTLITSTTLLDRSISMKARIGSWPFHEH